MKNPGGSPRGKGNGKPPHHKVSKRQTQAESWHTKQSIPAKFRRISVDTKSVITYVLDTNVIMSAWDSLFKFEEHDVCIVSQVLEELDTHKKGHTPEAWNVRQAIRAIGTLLEGKSTQDIQKGVQLVPPSELINGKPHTGTLHFDFTKPVAHKEFDLDLNHPDNRIILICLALKEEGKRVVLVSNDGSCRIKASVVGLDAEEYLSDTVGLVEGEEDLTPGFHTMPSDFFDSNVGNPESAKGVSQYTFEHPDLAKVTCNEFLLIPEQEPLRVISKNSTTNVVAQTFSHHSDLKEINVVPRNIEQAIALQLLLDINLPAVSLAGKAGSGKTFLTLAAGLHLLRRGVYKRIIFTRSMFGSDEDIGFLPGTEEEKLAPWMGGLYDNLESLLELRGEGEQNASDEAIRKLIQIKALNFMKGRSIANTLIIVDETQDLTVKKLKMISTRVGMDSKIVFLGNVAQIDDPYLTEHTCGLSVYIRTLRTAMITGHVTLQSGERSAFATLAEERL